MVTQTRPAKGFFLVEATADLLLLGLDFVAGVALKKGVNYLFSMLHNHIRVLFWANNGSVLCTRQGFFLVGYTTDLFAAWGLAFLAGGVQQKRH